MPGDSLTVFPAENIPWDLYKISSKGLETIDGAQTEHLSIQLDFEELWNQLDSETRDLFGQSFGVSGLEVPELVGQIEIKRLDFWIDAQGYNRRLVTEMLMGDTLSVTMDMRMSDFGEDIVIALPKEYTDVFPLIPPEILVAGL